MTDEQVFNLKPEAAHFDGLLSMTRLSLGFPDYAFVARHMLEWVGVSPELRDYLMFVLDNPEAMPDNKFGDVIEF